MGYPSPGVLTHLAAGGGALFKPEDVFHPATSPEALDREYVLADEHEDEEHLGGSVTDVTNLDECQDGLTVVHPS